MTGIAVTASMSVRLVRSAIIEDDVSMADVDDGGKGPAPSIDVGSSIVD